MHEILTFSLICRVYEGLTSCGDNTSSMLSPHGVCVQFYSSVKFSDHYKFEKIKYHFRRPILKISGVSLELIFFFHTPTVIKKIKYPFRRPILKISGVSLELIFFFQNFKNHRTQEIACWCE